MPPASNAAPSIEKPPASVVISVADSPLSPRGTMTSIGWNAADQVPSASVST